VQVAVFTLVCKGLVRTCAENLVSTRIRCPDCPARSKSL